MFSFPFKFTKKISALSSQNKDLIFYWIFLRLTAVECEWGMLPISHSSPFFLRSKRRGKQLGQGTLHWGGRAGGLSFGRGPKGDWKLRLHSGFSADSLIRRGNWVGYGHAAHFQDTGGVPWQDHELFQRGTLAKGRAVKCNTIFTGIWSNINSIWHFIYSVSPSIRFFRGGGGREGGGRKEKREEKRDTKALRWVFRPLDEHDASPQIVSSSPPAPSH